VVAKPEDVVEGMPLEGDIWTVDARGVGRVALTSGGYRNLRPDWGSDGRVYFMSNRGGRDVIWAVSSGEAMVGIVDESDSGVASTATIAGVDTTGEVD
jgi:Tol biopolymer transport system component